MLLSCYQNLPSNSFYSVFTIFSSFPVIFLVFQKHRYGWSSVELEIKEKAEKIPIFILLMKRMTLLDSCFFQKRLKTHSFGDCHNKNSFILHLFTNSIIISHLSFTSIPTSQTYFQLFPLSRIYFHLPPTLLLLFLSPTHVFLVFIS